MNDSGLLFQGTGFESATDSVTTNEISPTHRPSLGLHTSGDNAFNDKHSPLQLSSMLNSMSMNGENPGQLKQNNYVEFQGPYILRLKNLPNDITLRECYAIFALAENILNIELIKGELNKQDEPSIQVKFESLILASQYASVLSSKSEIFGPDYPLNSFVEVIDEHSNKQIPYRMYVPSINNYQLSSSDLNNFSNLPTTSASAINGSTFEDGLPKKSRFSFSDTFTNDSTLLNQSQQHQKENQTPSSVNILHNQQQQSSQQQPLMSNHNPSFHDLSTNQRDVGKSILLMENDEINDTIWGSNGISFNVNEVANAQQPSTPIFEWGSTSGRKQSNAFSYHQTVNNVSSQSSVSGGNNQLSGIAPDGFLPSSNGPMTPFGMVPQDNSSGQPLLSSIDQGLQSSQQRSPFHVQDSLQQDGQINKSQAGTPQKIPLIRNNRDGQPIMGSQKNGSTPSLPYNNISGSSTISQADLSLLAKVPPPANPADQNPPCNTLYVGNLPSDATEQELRQLFSTQQGFRRLSFRNKNSNGNGHGPICFVEFDDVSFATRALAELYGSQLPSANVSNKGGIRLSFSKNPLGVRGPNSRRNNSTTNINGTTNSSNYSYVPGYNKS